MKTIAEIQSELRKLCQELEALKQEQEAKAKEVVTLSDRKSPHAQ